MDLGVERKISPDTGTDVNLKRRGVDMGPSALRMAGLSEQLRHLGHTVIDMEVGAANGDSGKRPAQIIDIPIETAETLAAQGNIDHRDAIADACNKLCRTVEDCLSHGEFPLVLGGDHAMAIGTVAGIANHCRQTNQKLGVLWVDAHADINTPQSSKSQNVHGMPVAVIIGQGDLRLTSVGGNFPKLDPECLVYIGLRDVEHESEWQKNHPGQKPNTEEMSEVDRLKALGLHGDSETRSFTMSKVDELGISEVISRSLEHMQKIGVTYLHVSFDLDSVDPIYAPGVGTPVPGGLTNREAHSIMEAIALSPIFKSLEIAEVNPILDERNKSAELAVDLIASSMGKKIL